MLDIILTCVLATVFSAIGIISTITMIFSLVEYRKQAKRNEARELRGIEYHEKRMKDFK